MKVSVGQISIQINEEKKNLQNILKFIDVAADQGSDIIAFPECSNNGYVFDNLQHAFEKATPIPGPFTEILAKKARDRNIFVVIGLSEQGPYPQLWNSGILIDAKGKIAGKYQKNYLASVEKLWFHPSKTGFPVFHTELGNIGIFICADGRIFENVRLLTLSGADILFDLTGWTDFFQARIITPARAVENGVWLVAANKVGYEGPAEYALSPEAVGTSFIMSPKGDFICKASSDKEEIISAVVNPSAAKDKKIGLYNNIFNDRRTEVYGSLVEPVTNLPISRIVKTPILPESFCINAAALQIGLENAGSEESLNHIICMVERASSLLCQLIVLPEMFNIGRIKKDGFMGDMAETVPGPSTEIFSMISRRHGNYILGSILEEENNQFFNTAFLSGPKGYMGKYRKVHLWGDELFYLSHGDILSAIFNTDFGNLGIMIGYDGFFPETARILTLQGADVIAWPALWDSEIYPSIICPARSIENKIFIIAATQIGKGMVGRSMISDPDGRILSNAKKGIVQYVRGKLDLYHSRNKKNFINSSVIFDRRPDLYHILSASIENRTC
jgi:predicted amidohydrolase